MLAAPIVLLVPIICVSVAESFPMVSAELSWTGEKKTTVQTKASKSCCTQKHKKCCADAAADIRSDTTTMFIDEFVLFRFVVCIMSCLFVSVWIACGQIFSDSFVRLSRRFNDITILRRAAAIVSIGSVGAINLTDMIICSSSSTNHPGLGTASTALNGTAFQSTVCTLYPSYFSNFAILILIATAVVVQLTHMVKFGIMLTIAGTKRHYYFNIIFYRLITVYRNCRRVNSKKMNLIDDNSEFWLFVFWCVHQIRLIIPYPLHTK